MRQLRTQTFPLGKYRIEVGPGFLGQCEQPDKRKNPPLHMDILEGDTQVALATLIEEAAHACGIPDKYLHAEDKAGRVPADHIARLAWRRGWRLVQE